MQTFANLALKMDKGWWESLFFCFYRKSGSQRHYFSWSTWISAPNWITIHPTAAEILKSTPKWWTEWQTNITIFRATALVCLKKQTVELKVYAVYVCICTVVFLSILLYLKPEGQRFLRKVVRRKGNLRKGNITLMYKSIFQVIRSWFGSHKPDIQQTLSRCLFKQYPA